MVPITTSGRRVSRIHSGKCQTYMRSNFAAIYLNWLEFRVSISSQILESH